MIHVGNLGTAKTPVDNIERFHVVREGVPKVDTRTARENDGARFRWMNPVGLLELSDRRFPELSTIDQKKYPAIPQPSSKRIRIPKSTFFKVTLPLL